MSQCRGRQPCTRSTTPFLGGGDGRRRVLPPSLHGPRDGPEESLEGKKCTVDWRWEDGPESKVLRIESFDWCSRFCMIDVLPWPVLSFLLLRPSLVVVSRLGSSLTIRERWWSGKVAKKRRFWTRQKFMRACAIPVSLFRCSLVCLCALCALCACLLAEEDQENQGWRDRKRREGRTNHSTEGKEGREGWCYP